MACKSYISNSYIYKYCNRGNRLSLLRKRQNKSYIKRTKDNDLSCSWRRGRLNSSNGRESEGQLR